MEGIRRVVGVRTSLERRKTTHGQPAHVLLEPPRAAAPTIAAVAMVAVAALATAGIPTAAALAAMVASIPMILAALAALALLVTTAFALILAAACSISEVAALFRQASFIASPVCHTRVTPGVTKTEPPIGVPVAASNSSCTRSGLTAVCYLTAQGRVGRQRQSALASPCATS